MILVSQLSAICIKSLVDPSVESNINFAESIGILQYVIDLLVLGGH